MKGRVLSLLVFLALASVNVLGGAIAIAQSAPTIDVDPTSAPPGATIRVTGTGFFGDCDALLFWGSADGAIVGRAPVSADGGFSSEITVPAHAAAGPISLIAYGRSAGLQGCGDFSGATASSSIEVDGPIASMFSRTIPLVSRALRAPLVDEGTINRAKAAGRGIHAIVQLHSLPETGDLSLLNSLGIVPLAYLNTRGAPGTAYLAALRPTIADQDARFGELVRAVHPLLPADKIELGLATGIWGASPTGQIDTLIVFFSDVSPLDAGLLFTRYGIVATRDGQSLTYRASLSRSQIYQLATEDSVQFLAAVPPTGQLDLDNSRALINVDALQQFDVPSATYLGLTGLGVQLSIHDSGVDDHHNDFAGRIIVANHPAQGGDHGTHVASIAAGSGVMSNQNDDNSSPNGGTAFQWRGMAPQAQIAAYGSQTADSILTMGDAIINNGVDVSNHSYSYNDGQYDGTMASIDAIIRGDAGIPPRPVVFSAGNQGTQPQFGMNSGYFSLSKSCKNCIMVANLQDNGVLNGGSSHGPTPDGRLKPDIGANGSGVIAAGADVHNGVTPTPGPSVGNSYRSKGGTSMSTPAVTGTIALLLQQYAAQFGVNLDTAPPLPSTVKAILIQTAVDLTGTASGTNPDTGAGTVYGAGPDWGTGYGQVDAQAASALIAAELFVEDSVAEDNVTDNHLVSVVPGQSELRVTLAWDDIAGTPNSNHAAPALVNDLDLLLIGPNGEVARPLVMAAATQFDCDGDATNGTQTGSCTPGADPGPFNTVAAPGTDRLNNVEQVVFASPAPGLWRARVSVLNTDGTIRLPLGGTQPYSLAGVSDDRADLRISKSDSPDPAIAGNQLYYTINVINDGPDDATNVTVVDTLPAGVEYVTNDLFGGCVESPEGTLTCSVGDIPANQSRFFTIKVAIFPGLVASNGGPLSIFNTATAYSNTPDEDISDNTDTEGTIVEDLADLEVTKICKPDRPLNAGETGTCTIFVDNHGPSDARNVKVTDVMLSDGSFTVSNVTPSQGSCGAITAITGGKKFTCSLMLIVPASPSFAGRATVSYDVSSNEAADINDLATAVSDTPDPNDDNNSAQETISVNAVADMSLEKSGPATGVAGTNIVYSLTATNNGPSTAEGVVISDVLPDGVSIVSVAGSGGATCNAGVPGNAAVPTQCSFGTLAPSASRTMTVEVRILPDTRGLIHNNARVSSDTFDDDLSDNLGTVATDVTGEADLSITKTDSPDPVIAGNELTYTITVSNGGPSTATDVKITDNIPPGTTFVSGFDGNGTTVCALVQDATVVCDLGTMPPATSKVVYLTVAVAPSVPEGAVLDNTAEVTSSTTDPNSANNTALAGTDVRTQAELWLDKTGELISGNPSKVMVFTLTVHNDAGCESDLQSSPTPTCGDGGPSDAKNITVTDVLPLDPKKVVVQYISPECTYDQPTHTVTCTSANVPAGATVAFTIEVQIAGSVGAIDNTGSLTSTTSDPVADNNIDSISVVVKGGTGKK